MNFGQLLVLSGVVRTMEPVQLANEGKQANVGWPTQAGCGTQQ